MQTKMADAKGRVTLGANFANKLVIIQHIDDTEVRVTAAAVIPEREAWLHKNPAAMAQVQAGIEQARRGQFTKSPPVIETTADGELPQSE